ncbi:MAG: hypothetical protein HFG27_06210 [Provencibacterium sp.]|jgi:predicted amidohydrolase|nr:hypothetical protein [Provencibacterium sp.]
MFSLKSIAAAYRLSARLEPEKCEQVIASLKIKRSTVLDYVYPNNVKLAAVQMQLAPCRDMPAFIQDCCRIIDTAIKSGAHLVLFPHLTGALLLSTEKNAQAFAVRFIQDAAAGKASSASLKQRFDWMMDKFSDFLFDCTYNIFLLLAHKYSLYIAVGGLYIASTDGIFCRSYLFSPDQPEAFFQDKIQLSPLERQLGVSAGNEMKVFDLKIGKTAILAETDSLYYECFKTARALGADIVLCPSLKGEALPGCPDYNPALQHAQHFNLYTARSCFCSSGEIFSKFPGASGIYAPLMLSKDLDGVVAAAEPERPSVTAARIDPPKLTENIDVYSLNAGTGLCETLANSLYPQFFQQLACARETAGRKK